jgi:prepilin-type N-terminal cleavage/methylation domain-containing protein
MIPSPLPGEFRVRVKKAMNIRKIIKIKNKKGFSLIEMMVVVVILGLIVLGLVTFFTGGARSWIAGQSQLKAQREARQAMDRMIREMREGKNITSGSETSITVYIPPLGGNTPYSVKFELLDTTTIQRDSNPLIDNVLKISGEDIFEYYDSSGIKYDPPDITTLPTISKIHINLKVDVDKDNYPDITLNTDVNLRNFGLQ